MQGALVERDQFGLGEGPAAFGNAGARGEVESVELEDLASPADGGSTFDPNAAGVDAAMRKAGDFAVVEGLRGVFADRATALQKQHFFALAGELDGERDAGGSRADDADVCEEAGWRCVVEEVVDHGRTARAGFAEGLVVLRVDRRYWIRSMMSPTCRSLW